MIHLLPFTRLIINNYPLCTTPMLLTRAHTPRSFGFLRVCPDLQLRHQKETSGQQLEQEQILHSLFEITIHSDVSSISWGFRDKYPPTYYGPSCYNERPFSEFHGPSCCLVYYESMKLELQTRPIYECRCDERLKPQAEESTRLTYTVL
jgi:hypothetical protein